MAIKIDSKIVNYSLANDASASGELENTKSAMANVIQMHETLERPEMLVGSTYKLKTPAVSEHAMYITINDIVLNEGTEHELRRPFEVFINSKNLDHFQWIVALTRIMSAVFRKGGDVTFLVEELRSVFDPRGGYWVKGAYKQSIIAEIGDVIERHLIKIGMLQPREMDEAQKELIRQKREDLKKKEARQEQSQARTDSQPEGQPDMAGSEAELALTADASGEDADLADGFPPDAQLCTKCNHRSAIIMDGCMTCLNCGESKCG